MSPFAKIVARAEAESLEDCRKEVKNFHPQITGRIQTLVDAVSFFIPSLRRSLKERDAKFLELLREYIPQIKAQIERYHEMFYQWERANRRDGDGSYAIREEKAAWEKATELTQELQTKLTENGWNYLPLLRPEDDLTISPYPGQLMIGKAITYYDNLLKVFETRAS